MKYSKIFQLFDIIKMQVQPTQISTTVVFILGGPGSGKGTQSSLINEHFKFVHLSAGDLLREERKTAGSPYGQIIDKCIVEGKIVKSDCTVGLLENAMKKSGFENGKFLIDGFPRNMQNLSAWEKTMNDRVNVPFLLHLECPEQLMEARLLERGKTSGRSDDNIECIKKRFHTHQKQTIPIVEYYDNQKKCKRILADSSPKEVFQTISKIFKENNL